METTIREIARAVIETTQNDITEAAIRQIISKKYKEGRDYKVIGGRGQYLTNDNVKSEIVNYFKFKFLNK